MTIETAEDKEAQRTPSNDRPIEIEDSPDSDYIVNRQKSFVKQSLLKDRAVIGDGVFEEYAEIEQFTCSSIWEFISHWFRHSYFTFSLSDWPLTKIGKNTLPKDLIAGLSVAVLLIPQSMACKLNTLDASFRYQEGEQNVCVHADASLAGLPAVYGIYSSTVPLFVYTFFASSTCLSIGPVAPVAILVHSALEGIEGDNIENALSLSVVTGGIQLLFAALRFGFISSLLSWPIMGGYTTAAAFIIVGSQLDSLLQLGKQYEKLCALRGTDCIFYGSHADTKDENYFPVELVEIFSKIYTVNGFSALFGIVSLVILFGIKYVKIRGKKLPRWFPVQLLVAALAVLISWGSSAHEAGNVDIVGHIPSGFPTPRAPNLSGDKVTALVPGAFVLAIIIYVGNFSLASVFGKEKGETVSPNMEMLATGAACCVGGFFNSFPVGGSFSRTAVNYDLGAVTPLAVSFTGVLMLLVLLWLAPLFEYLPMTVLAAMVISSVKSLIKLSDAIYFWKNSKRDCLIFWATFLATLFIGIDNGVLAAMGLSLALLLYRSFKPRITELAVLPDTDVFIDVTRFPQARFVPGVVVLRIDGELHYGNVATLSSLIYDIKTRVERTKEPNDENNASGENSSSSSVSPYQENEESGQRWRKLKGIVIDGCRVTGIDAHAVRELKEAIEICLKSKAELSIYLASFPGPVRDKLWQFGLLRSMGSGQIHLTVPSAVNALLGREAIPVSGGQNRRAVMQALYPDSVESGDDESENISATQRRSSDIYIPRRARKQSVDENVVDEMA